MIVAASPAIPKLYVDFVDSDIVTGLIDSAYVVARAGTGTDSATVSSIIIEDVDANFINALTIGADSLGGQAPSHYLDYNNFTNTPSIPTLYADFVDSGIVTGLIDSSYVAARSSTAGTDSATVSAIIINDVDANFINALTIGADSLGGQAPSHYLDYNNFTNTPTIPTLYVNFVDSTQVTKIINSVDFVDSTDVSNIITADVDAAFINALTIDADTLGGQNGAYYLNYNNFTNKPTILDSSQVQTVSRNGLVASDAGGDGSFTYDSSTGNFTYTGPSATETRAHFSGGTGITYNAGTGAFSTTDGEIVHDNLSGFVANEHIDHTSVSITAGKGLSGGGTIASTRTLDIDSANVRGMFSGGVGITYSSGTGVISAPQALDSTSNPTFNQLRGPATFIIDPATIGDNTGTVRILGNLTVEGTTTTINSTDVSVNDKTFIIADSASDSSGLNGAGIIWGNADTIPSNPTFKYNHTQARFDANRPINSTSFIGALTGNADTSTEATNVTVSANNSTDESTFVTFVDGATGTQGIETDTALVYNPSSNTMFFGGTTNGTAISQGSLVLKNAGTASYIDFYCESSNAHYTRIQSAAHADYSGNITLTLPTTTGTVALLSDVTDSVATINLINSTVDSAYVALREANNLSVITDFKDFVYTPSTATATFQDSDDNGNTLTYTVGKINVFFNGAKLVDTTDYTATNGTSVSLNGVFADSGDTVIISTIGVANQIDLAINTADSDLTTTNANQVVDTFAKASYRSAKYFVQFSHPSDSKFHTTEVLLVHNGSAVTMTQYGDVKTDSSLGTIDADISGSNVRLLVTPSFTNTNVDVRRIHIPV